MRALRVGWAIVLAACGGAGDGAGGGGGGGAAACAAPSTGLWATFDVGGESFSSEIDAPAGVEQAVDLWQRRSSASIPNGELVCAEAPYNCAWSFHQDPATIGFADVTTEVCDGLPSYVDAHCAAFGKYYCPWGAKLVALRDCRTDPACPAVPRE
ncbi:MAG TPA: hypothetical protein VHB21_10045 [Minicystis sp.]|nr:hypothetical protein [Minicystis sp.]